MCKKGKQPRRDYALIGSIRCRTGGRTSGFRGFLGREIQLDLDAVDRLHEEQLVKRLIMGLTFIVLDAVLFERRPQGVRKPHVFERFNGRGNRFTLRNDVPVVAVVIE